MQSTLVASQGFILQMLFYYLISHNLVAYWSYAITVENEEAGTAEVHLSNEKVGGGMCAPSLFSVFPLLLSARHFPTSLHHFTAEINCYVPNRLIVTSPPVFLFLHAFFGPARCRHRSPAEPPRSRARACRPVLAVTGPRPSVAEPQARDGGGVPLACV